MNLLGTCEYRPDNSTDMQCINDATVKKGAEVVCQSCAKLWDNELQFNIARCMEEIKDMYGIAYLEEIKKGMDKFFTDWISGEK